MVKEGESSAGGEGLLRAPIMEGPEVVLRFR